MRTLEQQRIEDVWSKSMGSHGAKHNGKAVPLPKARPLDGGARVGAFDGEFYSVAASPEGDRLVVCTSTGARVFETAKGEAVHELPRSGGGGGSIRSVVFSPDGGRIFGSDTHSIMAWDAFSGRTLHSAERDSESDAPPINIQLTVSEDGSRLLVPGESSIILWDTKKWEEAARAPCKRHPQKRGQPSTPVASFRGHSRAVWTEEERERRELYWLSSKEWNMSSAKTQKGGLSAANRDSFGMVSWSHDGRTVALDKRKEVWVYRVKGFGDSPRWLAGANATNGRICCAQLSPSGKRLLTGSDRGELLLTSVTRNKDVWNTSAHSGAVWGLAFLQDETSFISCGLASEGVGEAILWKVDV